MKEGGGKWGETMTMNMIYLCIIVVIIRMLVEVWTREWWCVRVRVIVKGISYPLVVYYFLHSYGIFTTLSPRTPTDHPLPPSTNNPDRPFHRYLPAPFRVPNLPTLRYFPLRGPETCSPESPSPTENDNDYSQPLFNLGPQPTRPSHPFHLPNRPAHFPAPFSGAEPPHPSGAEPPHPEVLPTSGCRTLQPRNSNDLPTRNTQPRSHVTLFSTQLSSHRKLSSTRLLRPPILFTIRAVLPTFLPTSPLPKTPPPRCSTDFPRHQHCQTELKV